MMTIYLVIVEDRHTDVMVYPFSDCGTALNRARKMAKNNCRFPDSYKEYDYGKDVGWLFYAEYSTEGDSVRVVAAEINTALIDPEE